MNAKEVLLVLRVSPSLVCDAIEWYMGNIVFDPIRIERWLWKTGRMGKDISVKDALERNFGKRIADAIGENIRKGGEPR